MPRNKRTEGAKLPDADSLPELTAKQMAFVRGILEDKTASDAYRAAYDAQNMAPDDIHREASLLRRHPKITQWVAAIRLAAMDRGKVTLEGHVAEMRRLKEIAIATGNVGAAVLAETNIGKASGIYTERYEDVSRGKTPDKELLSRLAEMVGPDAARVLAERMGVDPETVGKSH